MLELDSRLGEPKKTIVSVDTALYRRDNGGGEEELKRATERWREMVKVVGRVAIPKADPASEQHLALSCMSLRGKRTLFNSTLQGAYDTEMDCHTSMSSRICRWKVPDDNTGDILITHSLKVVWYDIINIHLWISPLNTKGRS